MRENKSVGAVFTYIFIALLTIAKAIGLSAGNKIYVLIFLIGMTLGVFKIFNERFNHREIALISPVIIIGILCFIIGKESTLLFTALVMITLKNADIKKLVKMMLWIKIIIFVCALLLVHLGLIEDNTIIVWRNGVEIMRHSFIYGHPNAAHLNLTTILIAWIYVYYEKVNILSVSILGIMNFIFYNYTLSRTGFLIGMLCLILAILYKKSNAIRKVLFNKVNWVFIIMSVITFTTALLYGKWNTLYYIDKLFTGRIYYNNYFLTNIQIPLIGKNNYGHLLIDNGYMSLVYNGGLLAYIWFIFMNIKTGELLKKEKCEKEALLMIVFCIYSLTESFYMNIIINISLLFFSWFIFNQSQTTKKKRTICK